MRRDLASMAARYRLALKVRQMDTDGVQIHRLFWAEAARTGIYLRTQPWQNEKYPLQSRIESSKQKLREISGAYVAAMNSPRPDRDRIDGLKTTLDALKAELPALRRIL